MRTIGSLIGVVVLLGLSSAMLAATPPDRINYQGVLRDAGDVPLDGDYDMIFRFYDASGGGSEILSDTHQASGTGTVTVTGGLFSVALGGGTVADGGGAGTYITLAAVFRDYSDVWIQIEIWNPDTTTWETLLPRVKVISSGYALSSENANNAASLDLLDSSQFLRSDGSDNFTAGTLTINGGTTLDVLGTMQAGVFYDRDDTDFYVDPAAGNNSARFAGDISLGYGSDTDIDTISFDQGNEYLAWNELNLNFSMSDDLYVGGQLDASSRIKVSSSAPALELQDAFHTTTLVSLYANDDFDYGYLFDYQNSRYMLYSDSAGIGVGTSSPQTGYSLTTPSLWASGGASYGVVAYGDSGGWFESTNGTGIGRVGYGDYGLSGSGSLAGTYGNDTDSGTWARTGYGSYKIYGSGSVSFVQNHPADPDRVIVYAAPEGDEVATYTRGTARLVGGEASVSLGETFGWVTNPDIGLTVYLTPVGTWSDLYVARKATDVIVVRSNGGDPDATFDYIVYGLRIGFEESGIVQEKDQEAYIPSMADHRSLYQNRPELRRFNALERFKDMARVTSLTNDASFDFTAAEALREAIVEFDPAVHELPVPPGTEADDGPGTGGVAATAAPTAPATQTPRVAPSGEPVGTASASAVAGGHRPGAGTIPVDEEGNAYARSFRSTSAELAEYHPVSEPVGVGDVLVADRDEPGLLRLGREAADPAVVGIVSSEPGLLLGSDMTRIAAADPDLETAREDARAIGDAEEEARVRAALEARFHQTHAAIALSGTVSCNVDAGYGTIRVGDLLSVSPTAGHAMRADDPLPGTVFAKALEPLDSGTGVIKVLVMLR